ncbi:DUF413 domain-containing protein [Paraglaciecola aquimarina]|uniref:Macrodomain Ori protein n=1 Tax=Paraglaciecola algarum TaxID=3050085 RepID=A0ABS9D7T5_9ALTE|nr:DUF413 domain-containing protein [Paraglaciecola sp. G1-23]MCF2948083.1 DUF413 domain-containing protein [Paraglaciecola sp. G1-23]
MAKLNRDTLLNQMFADPKNYPYGFSRSGDFSINESKALVQSGCLIAALVDGLIAPETDDDKELLAAAFAKKDPQTPAEKAWVKYQKRINRPKLGSIYGTHHTELEDDDSIDEDNDIEIELDED